MSSELLKSFLYETACPLHVLFQNPSLTNKIAHMPILVCSKSDNAKGYVPFAYIHTMTSLMIQISADSGVYVAFPTFE